MQNILLTNAGKRVALVRDFKQSFKGQGKIVVTDNWSVAPALFVADEYYLTARIDEKNYIKDILEICEQAEIKAITSLMDPDISVLAGAREVLTNKGILCLFPSEHTAGRCLDKYKMFQFLKESRIPTIATFFDYADFMAAYQKGEIDFPVFIKPKSGSGSVGAQKVYTDAELQLILKNAAQPYIIQEFIEGMDIDADVYVDAISHQVVSIFLKEKIERMIGGTSKAISIKDTVLFEKIKQICGHFEFCGPVDLEFLQVGSEYYLYDINPRFSGAYLHAYACGVDFPKLILNNIRGKVNPSQVGEYETGQIMMLYPDVALVSKHDLKRDYRD
ncbi:ATP-grasp domain-containing protein [Clostridiales bacterium COT073_COT-073]|nr:ATP-grasp domain-containing protein [Clostridiales bacterium COT073_COT-073]